jgi:hypothetical protein
MAEDHDAEPMKFSLYRADLRPQFGLIQDVYASGVIVSGTASAFTAFVQAHGVAPGGTVLLDSPGGLLDEGLKLGDAIRSAGLNTDVGVRGPGDDLRIGEKFGENADRLIHAMGVDAVPPKKLPGSCLSACTMAFLGGVQRYFNQGSVYGVHRFSFPGNSSEPGYVDAAQITSGIVVGYIEKMGVDPKLFTRLTEAGPNDIRIISQEELVALKVVTGRALKEEWTFKSLPEGIYVTGTLVDDRGVSKMTFVCDRKTKKMVSVAYIPEGSNPDGDVNLAKLIASQSVDAGYFVDNEIRRLMSTGRQVTIIPSQGKPGEHSEIEAIWGITPADIASITAAKDSTGFALLPATPGIFYGFRLSLGAQGREIIRNYATDCWR